MQNSKTSVRSSGTVIWKCPIVVQFLWSCMTTGGLHVPTSAYAWSARGPHVVSTLWVKNEVCDLWGLVCLSNTIAKQSKGPYRKICIWMKIFLPLCLRHSGCDLGFSSLYILLNDFVPKVMEKQRKLIAIYLFWISHITCSEDKTTIENRS